MANNTKSNSKLVSVANGTGKGIAEVSPAQLRAVAEQNLQSLLEAADTMTTLKAAEAGDVLMVVSPSHELSMQMVLRREGFRGRDQARTELDLQNMVTGDVFQHVIRGNQLPSDMLAALGVKVPRRASGKSPQVVASTTRVVAATPVSVPVAPTAVPTAVPTAAPVMQPESLPQTEQLMETPEEVVSSVVAEVSSGRSGEKGVASSFASLILAGKDDSGSDEDPEAEEDEALCAVMAEDEERRFQNEDEEEETSDNEEEEEDFGSDEDFEEDEDSEDSDGE